MAKRCWPLSVPKKVLPPLFRFEVFWKKENWPGGGSTRDTETILPYLLNGRTKLNITLSGEPLFWSNVGAWVEKELLNFKFRNLWTRKVRDIHSENNDGHGGAIAEAKWGYSLCLRPKNLNIAELVQQRTPAGKEQWKSVVFMGAAERVIHTICEAYERGKARMGYFVPIDSRDLKRLCGRDSGRRWRYKEVLAMLTHFGVVEVNPRYSTGDSGAGKSFPKSYRLGAEYRRFLSFGHSIQERKGPARARNVVQEFGDPILEFWATNAARVSVDEAELKTLANDSAIAPNRFIRVLNSAGKILRGEVHLKTGRVQRRIYHTITDAPREVRKALRLDGEPLVEVDVKSCQPTLLLFICPAKERAAFKQALRDDLYSLSSSPREMAKKQFGQFAFGAYKRQNALGKAIQERFPELAAAIRGFDGSLGATLQDIEAEICVYGVGWRLLTEGIFAVGIHDAFLVLPADAMRVVEIVQEEFAKRLPDFPVEVRVK
jgi:hypothetical protein